MNLAGKTIIITGASQGLGESIALKTLALKASIIVIDKVMPSPKLKKEINSKNNIFFYRCDVRDYKSVKLIMKKILKKHQVDILINNAGIWTDSEIEKSKADRRKEVLESNTLGMINITEEVLPLFIKRNGGLILNVVSVAATNYYDDISEWRVYGASKWGAKGYTKALRDRLGNTKIKISAIYPGGFDSNLYENAGWDKKKAHNQLWMMKKEDVAEAVIFMVTRPNDVVVDEMIINKAK